MPASKADIIAQLKKDILPLQGFKSTSHSHVSDTGLGPIKNAFPNGIFPVGAVHEFFCMGPEDGSASGGFIAGLLSALMQSDAVCLWISATRTLFPPALSLFGIDPARIIFIDLQREREILWVMEEALKCNGLAAVIGEMQEISFTASRRLQLAVEQSQVTGFIIRRNPRNMATACVTRWQISSLPSALINDMPGVGFPRWNVELLKVRNGKPGSWQVEWVNGRFKHVSIVETASLPLQKKVG